MPGMNSPFDAGLLGFSILAIASAIKTNDSLLRFSKSTACVTWGSACSGNLYMFS